jgi:hypothetical protein
MGPKGPKRHWRQNMDMPGFTPGSLELWKNQGQMLAEVAYLAGGFDWWTVTIGSGFWDGFPTKDAAMDFAEKST